MTAHKRHLVTKDSGVAWLGKIPAHWDVVQSRRMFDERKEKARPGDVLLTASQKYGMIPQSKFIELEGRRVVEINKGANSLIHVEAGDFVISLRSFQGGLEFSRTSGSITFHYVPIHAVKWVHEPFFAHLFKSRTYIQALRATANLIRDGQDMRYSHFAQVPLPVIPLKEQVDIADHLDRETARIDSLVARKTRFMELLAEKRQALITHAVTKGVDPNAQMKHSGVDWLGEVPRHWKNIKIRLLADKIGSGKTPSGGAEVYVEEGITFLRSQNIYDNEIRLNDVAYITDEIHTEMANTKVKPKDVLLNITGGSIGRTSLVPDDFGEANVNQHVCIVRLQDVENAEWVHMAFRADSTKKQIDGLQVGANREGLNFEQVGNLRIALPPPVEMRKILVYLKSNLARIDTLIGKTEHSLELLSERRTALISAAVTGKIDLRENA